MDVIDYFHEWHPYDWLFIVPAVISALLFWKHQSSRFSFIETVFGSAVTSAFVSVSIMALMLGAWSLIGITIGMIALFYLPVCAVVGLIISQALKRA